MDDLAIGDPVELEFIELLDGVVEASDEPVRTQRTWVPATVTFVGRTSFSAAIANGSRYTISTSAAGGQRWRKPS